MREHLKSYNDEILTFVDLKKNDIIVDIGSNDSTMLQYYGDKYRRIGVDPTGNQFKEYYGIVMICIHPNYRGKGLGKKLIEKHFDDNKNNLVCLNTRRSNINAYLLYKKMGYEQIGFIKNKYFLPSEDSVFMIKEL
jgi:ribosomal protein S18 acetylase RimI-like enzyme